MSTHENTDTKAWREQWQQWARGAAGGGATAATLERLARGYREFGERLLALGRGQDGSGLARALADLIERYARGERGEASGLDGLFGALPAQFAAAQAVAGGAGGLEHGLLERLLSWADEFLALPPVGPLRDWQLALQACQRAALAERQAAGRVNVHYRAVHRAALERYAHWLRQDTGAPVESLRALYDAWVEHAEAAYAEAVMTDDFAADFAAWVDAGSAARLAGRTLRERVAQTLDLPQRAEVDTLLARGRALEDTVAGLRREVAALEARLAVAATAAPVREPRAEERVAPASERRVEPMARDDEAPVPSGPSAAAEPAAGTRRARVRKRPAVRPAATRPAGAAPSSKPRKRGGAAPAPLPARFDIGDILAGRE